MSKPHVIFIDPASISTGCAIFTRRGRLVKHMTIKVDKKRDVFDRLQALYEAYRAIASEFERSEVHIEQLVRNTHIYTHWSVGVIGAAFAEFDCNVYADIPINSWQKYCLWNGSRKPIVKYKGKVDSEDELAAIGMGLYWFNK